MFALLSALVAATLFAAPVPGTQLLAVTSPRWNSRVASLQQWARDPGGTWKSAGGPIAVNLGKNGLAWGLGLNPETDAAEGEPQKTEGDGTSPAGIFKLGPGFGIPPKLMSPNHGWSYSTTPPDLECVDDEESGKFYNQLIQPSASEGRPWRSSESMFTVDPDAAYALGIPILHNSDPVRAGKGSCIFLHISRGPRQPTVGCTGLAKTKLEEILKWLDPKRHPVLVQLPSEVYSRVRKAWDLP